MSSLTPGECRVRVGRSIETDPTRTSSHPAQHRTRTSSNAPPEHQQNKRSASNEFQARVLASHTVKWRRNRYIEIPNQTSITSSLSWWKANVALYTDLSKMARDVLATPASGCAVERVLSVSGQIATSQCNWLSADTISNLMGETWLDGWGSWRVSRPWVIGNDPAGVGR
jgi:hypothetical protein